MWGNLTQKWYFLYNMVSAWSPSVPRNDSKALCWSDINGVLKNGRDRVWGLRGKGPRNEKVSRQRGGVMGGVVVWISLGALEKGSSSVNEVVSGQGLRPGRLTACAGELGLSYFLWAMGNHWRIFNRGTTQIRLASCRMELTGQHIRDRPFNVEAFTMQQAEVIFSEWKHIKGIFSR